MTVSGRRLGGAVLATAGLLACAWVASGSGAVSAADGGGAAAPPSQWASAGPFDLRLEGWPNAIRFSGANRYETSLATSLGLRGQGQYPFDTPDRSSAGGASLAAASGWWGAGRCPRSIIVVSGGSPADALAASALSDPTGLSAEPLLTRSASADPDFDPVGVDVRVDTEFAPIIVTAVATDAKSGLSAAARAAARDMRNGGCKVARQAIIVGGNAAVAPAVDTELLALGYGEVFRVAGLNRYDTAARVARSLGTAEVPAAGSNCSDPRSDDGTSRMSFIANAAVEYRSSPGSCQVLGRTVVLADGVTGADALAAGWWTAFFQVPVLLHDGTGTLPAATADALKAMNVDHVIVLGGTSRINAEVADQAGLLATASVVRISGDDRYATSVQMAKLIGGWWPTGTPGEFDSSMVCLASSSGAGSASSGWPDALGAGPFCGALNGASSAAAAPTRALLPINGPHPATTPSARVRPAHDAVPILLVPSGGAELPSVVSELLRASFDTDNTWCTSLAAHPGCAFPGLVVGFGGSAALTDSVMAQASTLVSGSTADLSSVQDPNLTDVFTTTLDMSPVFATEGAGADAVCTARAPSSGARWLAIFRDRAALDLAASSDLYRNGLYNHDGDFNVRTPGSLAPTCVRYDESAGSNGVAQAVGPAGRSGTTVDLNSTLRWTMSNALSSSQADSGSGVPLATPPSAGGSTTRSWVFSKAQQPTGIETSGVTTPVTGGSVTIALVRNAGTSGHPGLNTFTATFRLTTITGTVDGAATGEAIAVDGGWELRSSAIVEGGSWAGINGSAGFSAGLRTSTTNSSEADAVTLHLDGLVSPNSPTAPATTP